MCHYFNGLNYIDTIASETDNNTAAAIAAGTISGVIVIIAVIVLIIGAVLFYQYRKGKIDIKFCA